jgi:hypothetical protein
MMQIKERFKMRTDLINKKELILEWIAEELPKSEMARRLGCKQETLNAYLTKMNITYAGQQAKKGQQKGSNVYKDSSYYLGPNALPITSHKLKLKLIRDGLKADKCEYCGNSHWLGVKLPLELHHEDGNHYNNELSNLKIVCPNCHSVLGDNSGAAVGNYQK